MNILVIEDDNMLRRALGHYLLDIGHSVSACSNGQEALEHVKKNRTNIDLVIVDILLPVLSGPSFILLLEKYYSDALPRIIVISGVHEGEAFLKRLDVRFDHYVAKPIDFEDLGDLVNSFAQQKAG